MNKLFSRNYQILVTAILLFVFTSGLLSQTKRTVALGYRDRQLPFGLTEKTAVEQPIIALVLSGGGARGLAQIGVLKALVKNNIPVEYIVGTSMGSIIGGLYSAGYSIDELDSIVSVIPWQEFLTVGNETDRNELFVDQKVTEDRAILALRLEGFNPVLPTSINNGQKLSGLLNLLTLNAPLHANSSFNDLRYNYKAVCTDLISGRPIVLEQGSLSQAMRASAAVSLFLSPIKIDSLLLVDGGLVANIPIEVAQKTGSDYIIALNTTSPLNTEADLSMPWNVADQLISIPMRLLASQQLNNANIIIEPDLGRKRNNDFTNIDSIIQKGYNSALPFIGKIESEVKRIFNTKIKEKEFFIKSPFFDTSAAPEFKRLAEKYSTFDSLGSHDILFDLYKMQLTGDYDSLAADVYEDSGKATIRFFAQKHSSIKDIKLYGVTLLEKAVTDSIFNELKNKPFNRRTVLNKLIEVMKIYRSKGLSLAEIENIGYDNEGILFVRVSEGIISSIIVTGNDKTRTDIIRREFPLKEGEYFSYQKAEQGLLNLRSTNLFNDVNLAVSNHGSRNTVMLKVAERPSNLLRFGLRMDNESQLQVSFDLRDENLIGSATELGLIASGGARNRSFILEHKANRIFDTYFTYKVRGFYEFADVYTYADDTVSTSDRYFYRTETGEYRQIYRGVSLGLGTQVARFGNLILEGKYQRDKIKNKRDHIDTEENNSITSLQLSSTIDSQDRFPYPHKGFNVKTVYETAQKAFGGDVSYTKFYFDYTSHFSFLKDHTITPRFLLGFADNTLPLSQHFSLGGQNSFLGMRENEFRGRQIMLSSIRHRYRIPYRIFFDTYISWRYDIGSVWSTRKHIRFKDLRHGAGATISFDTPLGPADFSVGRSFLFKDDSGKSKMVLGDTFFYFTIGYYY